MARPQVKFAGDLLILGMIVAAVTFVALTWQCPARGAECLTCRQPLRVSVVAPHVARVTYAATPYAPQVYNFIGAPVRIQAAQQHAMENAPEWEEFRQFQAFRAGMAAQQQAAGSPGATAATPGATPPAPGAVTPGAMQPPAEQLPPQPAPPGAADGVARPYEAAIPTTSMVCGRCHGRRNPTEPAGGLFLDGQGDIRGLDRAELQVEIMRRMLSLKADYKMPPDRDLTADEMTAVTTELFAGFPE